ncbi:MAG: hypothetical protein FWC41_09570 [Firmicutes bacterium]|nr:hypothetical protein [Bacillota bacterium]
MSRDFGELMDRILSSIKEAKGKENLSSNFLEGFLQLKRDMNTIRTEVGLLIRSVKSASCYKEAPIAFLKDFIINLIQHTDLTEEDMIDVIATWKKNLSHKDKIYD